MRFVIVRAIVGLLFIVARRSQGVSPPSQQHASTSSHRPPSPPKGDFWTQAEHGRDNGRMPPKLFNLAEQKLRDNMHIHSTKNVERFQAKALHATSQQAQAAASEHKAGEVLHQVTHALGGALPTAQTIQQRGRVILGVAKPFRQSSTTHQQTVESHKRKFDAKTTSSANNVITMFNRISRDPPLNRVYHAAFDLRRKADKAVANVDDHVQGIKRAQSATSLERMAEWHEEERHDHLYEVRFPGSRQRQDDAIEAARRQRSRDRDRLYQNQRDDPSQRRRYHIEQHRRNRRT